MFSGKNLLTDVTLNDQRLKELELATDEKGNLIISFDVSLFHDDWSGRMKLKIKTELAKYILDKLTESKTNRKD